MMESLLSKRESFLVETTLAGGSYIRMMKRAVTLGYKVRLIYVGTESVEINIQRIRQRVLNGGTMFMRRVSAGDSHVAW